MNGSKINDLHFDLPIIVVIEEGNEEAKNNFSKFNSTVVIDSSKKNIELYSRKIENLAQKYENKIDSPFFRALKEYTFLPTLNLIVLVIKEVNFS